MHLVKSRKLRITLLYLCSLVLFVVFWVFDRYKPIIDLKIEQFERKYAFVPYSLYYEFAVLKYGILAVAILIPIILSAMLLIQRK
ncbi:hypothetical protein [Gilvibacter sediminis]|uniref:hypothetical protein n=1 Tax=Gilvibacter sediminis TaxID=379071 RepID=UPI0023507D7D|nr:hypothetical protein [Gilvibacter sediminis]